MKKQLFFPDRHVTLWLLCQPWEIIGCRRQGCSWILPVAQLGRLSRALSFPWDWHRWAVVSHGCAKRHDDGLQMWLFLCALQFYSSMPSGVLVSSYNGTCSGVTAQLSPWQSRYKAAARAAQCVWYPWCWLTHGRWGYMQLSRTGTLAVLVGFSSHWPGSITVQSCANILTLLQPSLKTSFPLLQDQEKHREHQRLSLVLEENEGHCPPWCSCFLCWQAVPPWCVNWLVKALQMELVSPNAGRLRGGKMWVLPVVLCSISSSERRGWLHSSVIVQINILNLIDAASLVEASFKCRHAHFQLKQSLDSWLVHLG